MFGLTCPSLCSSQQSGDSSALCSPFLLLSPQKSPGPYPRISGRWIQPGVHPLSHQGRIKCPSCLAARLVPALAGAWRGTVGTDSAGRAGAAPLMGLGALDMNSCSVLVPSALAVPCRGLCCDPHCARQHWQHGAPARSHCASQCVQVIPTAEHPPRQERTHPECTDVASAGCELVVSWHMSGAQCRRALPGTQDSSQGSSQGLSLAQILSLAWSREFPPEWRRAAWLRQSERAR